MTTVSICLLLATLNGSSNEYRAAHCKWWLNDPEYNDYNNDMAQLVLGLEMDFVRLHARTIAYNKN